MINSNFKKFWILVIEIYLGFGAWSAWNFDQLISQFE
jgi:hypothetical protein